MVVFEYIIKIMRVTLLNSPSITLFIIESGFRIFLLSFSLYFVQKFNYNRVRVVDAYIVLAFLSVIMLNAMVKCIKPLIFNKSNSVNDLCIISDNFDCCQCYRSAPYIYWLAQIVLPVFAGYVISVGDSLPILISGLLEIEGIKFF